jgi:hypothetical protein
VPLAATDVGAGDHELLWESDRLLTPRLPSRRRGGKPCMGRLAVESLRGYRVAWAVSTVNIWGAGTDWASALHSSFSPRCLATSLGRRNTRSCSSSSSFSDGSWDQHGAGGDRRDVNQHLVSARVAEAFESCSSAAATVITCRHLSLLPVPHTHALTDARTRARTRRTRQCPLPRPPQRQPRGYGLGSVVWPDT